MHIASTVAQEFFAAEQTTTRRGFTKCANVTNGLAENDCILINEENLAQSL